MKAPDESGINKDFTEKSTDWIATDDKRCTDAHPCTKIRTIGKLCLYTIASGSFCEKHFRNT